MRTSKIKPGEKVWIPKSQMRNAPPGFRETIMGELRGANRQYRGPDNLHLREYSEGWELHQDYGDPRTLGGFIIHIFIDAPEIGLALLIAAGVYEEKYNKTKSIGAAISEAIGTGVLSYIGLRILKELIDHLIHRPFNQMAQSLYY